LGVVDADGSGGFRALTTGSDTQYGSASFFPDGRSVLAMAGSGFGVDAFNRLEQVSVDSVGGVVPVSSDLGEARNIANRAVLSADGTRVAFDGRPASNANVIRIFVLELAGVGAVRQVTDYPGDDTAIDGFPTWVGNAEVGFASNLGGSDNVYVLSAISADSGGFTLGSANQPWYGRAQ
jgi:TolB protein